MHAELERDRKVIKPHIWDTVGQERCSSSIPILFFLFEYGLSISCWTLMSMSILLMIGFWVVCILFYSGDVLKWVL